MKYRNRNDGTLLTQRQIVSANPNTSLPKSWTQGTYDFLEVDPVMAAQAPEVGPYEVAVRDGAKQDAEGNWVEAWTVQPMFVEYEAPVDGNDADLGTIVVTVDEQQEAYTAAKLAEARESMVITMRQCRLALLGAGLLDSVDTALASLPEPDKSAATIAWEYGATVERLSTFVVGMGPLLGLSDLEVDALFEGAKDL